MPKRRTTPKQRAASRRNLVKARAARNRYGGKSEHTTVYRHIPEKYAGATVKSGFKADRFGDVYVTTNKSKKSAAALFGRIETGKSAVMGVRVKRRNLGKDDTPLRAEIAKVETWHKIKSKHLVGRKIRRVG